MLFKTSILNANAKILNGISNPLDDFLFLDVKENQIYFEALNVIIAIPAVLENKENFGKPYLILSKSELLHISKFEEEIEINEKFVYQGKILKGTLKTSSEQINSQYINSLFNNFDGEELFTLNENNLALIEKASLFLDKEAHTLAFQCIHFKDRTISSSSMGRIYCSPSNIEEEGILHTTMVKFLLLLGVETKVLKGKKSFQMIKNGVRILFNSLINTDFIPVTSDKFINIIDYLKSSNKIILNKKTLAEKLNILNYYAKSKKNNMTLFQLKENKIFLSVDENSVELENLNEKILEENDDISFNFNLSFLDSIITNIFKNEEKIIIYENYEKNVILLNLEKSEENIIIGKLI